jgi:hypothetical protein
MNDTQVIRWWELRRILYNASLLIIGVAALRSMERVPGYRAASR